MENLEAIYRELGRPLTFLSQTYYQNMSFNEKTQIAEQYIVF